MISLREINIQISGHYYPHHIINIKVLALDKIVVYQSNIEIIIISLSISK